MIVISLFLRGFFFIGFFVEVSFLCIISFVFIVCLVVCFVVWFGWILFSFFVWLLLTVLLIYPGFCLVRALARGAMGRRIDPSWWTY